VLSLF